MVHLIVGNTGAGKTTYALTLKQKNNGILFSVDKWNATLFIPDKTDTSGVEWFLERIERSESIISDLIIQLNDSKVDAILDLGFAKIGHRKKFIDFCQQQNISVQIHYLDVPPESRWNRIVHRNNTKGDSYEFKVTRENFEFMESWFEPLTELEINDNLVTIINSR